MGSEWYHGTMLVILMVAFVGLWIWAWSRKRKATFDRAALLPLEDDNGGVPGNEKEKD